MEASPDEPTVRDCAIQSATKLDTLDSDFKSLQFQIIDLIDVGRMEELEKEQDILDNHDDNIAALSVRFQKLILTSSSSDTSNC